MIQKLRIDKLVFGGQGLGKINNKVYLVWNALPGEEVGVKITKLKRDWAEAVATEIIKPSPSRIPPAEDHFLFCSPWQILSWEEENRWKKLIAEEAYQRIGNLNAPADLSIVFDSENHFEYRNKMEYGFSDGSLAFFERGTHIKKAITGCQLAHPAIHEGARIVLEWLKKHPIRKPSLKSLVLRTNSAGQAVAALTVDKSENYFTDFPVLNDRLVGFQIYLANAQNPGLTPGKLLGAAGQNYLISELKEVRLKYGPLSFFQINLPVFEEALTDISHFLDPEKRLIDYYAGVGAISLPLSKKFKEAVLVDNNAESISYAKENILSNQLSRCQAILAPSEKMTDFIRAGTFVIFDPPRAGLHPKVIKKILSEKPLRILYLSCNVSTQARDIKLLGSHYKIAFLRLYNFFPRTPHIEALGVLDRTS